MRKANRLVLMLLPLMLAGAAAAQPPILTKLDVVGDHAGRLMKLRVDGRVEYDGRGHLDPPGVTWTINIAPGETPASVELSIEPCKEPFKADLPRNGGVHALVIQGCEIKVLRDG